MKNILRFSCLLMLVTMISCGSKQSDNNAESLTAGGSEKECQRDSHFSLEVNKEKLNNNETFRFSAKDFQIRSVEYIMKSDSLADIRISNYPEDSLTGIHKDDQIDICISLRSKNGKKLKPGFYRYMDFKAGYYAKVNIETSKGIIWFNWVSGMPEQGGVEVFQVDESSVCGAVDLAVDKADNASIGVVKLKGNFFFEEK